MKLINKNHPPASFVTYCKQEGVSFEDLDAYVKDDLKEALLDEQGWICGYCQQKINDKSQMKIEHHCEQSICNGQEGRVDKSLDYRNLMAVCLGKSGSTMHCDTNKANFSSGNGLPIEVSPWTGAHVNGIRYASTGKIESSNLQHSDEINRILNLNADYLKESRRKIWNIIYRSSVNAGVLNRGKMRRLTESNSQNHGGYYEVAFPGLYEFMLNRFC